MNFPAGDTRGMLIDQGDKIKRVCNGTDNYPQDIYDAYTTFNLSSYGIVQTSYAPDSRTFSHKKHRISYPYEWSPSLFKDVVLFHIDLLIHLDNCGLSLKDALPENILLDGVRPVFVDFFSLIRTEDLRGLSWLMEDAVFGTDPRLRVLELMFVPYMLIPMLHYARKEFEVGRMLLGECFCNNIDKKSGSWNMFTELNPLAGLFFRAANLLRPSCASRHHIVIELRRLCTDPDITWHKRLELLRSAVEACDVTPPYSDYVDYYAAKNENFGVNSAHCWMEKQRNVHRVLTETHPLTVLDIGANTGWYSRLACQFGASVIATDLDVKSIDVLYREARFSQHSLMPLWMSFDDFEVEHFSLNDLGDKHLYPLHMSATKRLTCDLVLCLALFHHLTLGLGKGFDDIFRILEPLTGRTLILEFIDLSDVLIQSDPGFFPNFGKWNSENYCLDVVIKAAMGYFSHCDILPSNPSSRSLLVLSKR